jgi:hypothetical protein
MFDDYDCGYRKQILTSAGFDPMAIKIRISVLARG